MVNAMIKIFGINFAFLSVVTSVPRLLLSDDFCSRFHEEGRWRLFLN